MKRIILAGAVLALMLSAGAVWSNGNNDDNGGCQGNCDGGGGNQQQGQLQGQKQGQAQGQLQGQAQIGINKNLNVNDSHNKAYGGDADARAKSSSYSGGNKTSQTVNYNDSGRADVSYSGEYTVKSAPSIALGGPASGPCNGFSGGIAGSGIGFGFAANTSTVDKGCEDRETARMFQQLGDTATGIEILKNSDSYKRLQEAKAEAVKKKAELESAPKSAASAPGSWTSAGDSVASAFPRQ